MHPGSCCKRQVLGSQSAEGETRSARGNRYPRSCGWHVVVWPGVSACSPGCSHWAPKEEPLETVMLWVWVAVQRALPRPGPSLSSALALFLPLHADDRALWLSCPPAHFETQLSRACSPGLTAPRARQRLCHTAGPRGGSCRQPRCYRSPRGTGSRRAGQFPVGTL